MVTRARTRNFAKARRVRAIQANIDKRTEAVTSHKLKIAQLKSELKAVRKGG